MHPCVYKRPLLWALILYIIGLTLFYHPAPKPGDASSFISSRPVALEGRVESFSSSKEEYHNVYLQVFRIDGQPAHGRVYARVKYTAPQWKDTVLLRGKLKKPYNVDLLGNFAWGDYLALKGVFAEIRAEEFTLVKKAAWPWRALRTLRGSILQTLQTHFTPQLAAIAGGVMLGERGVISPQLYTAFQDSGAIHLLVASGGNVGFVTLMAFAFCALFGLSRKKTVLVSLVLAGVYTLAAGADAPLVRAYFMALCACVGFLLNRNSGVFQGLVAACLGILIIQPGALFETGFQMSFLATLAIIICLNLWTLPEKWPKWARFFGQIFLATLASQLVLLPVFTNVFYKVSVVGLAANMLLVPLASVVMGAGFLFYVLDLLHMGFLLQGVLGGLLWLFKTGVELFASWPLASVPCAAWGVGWILAYYLVLFWLFHGPQRLFAKKLRPFCLAGGLVCLVGQGIYNHVSRGWILREWNHASVLVRTCEGETLLFGTGIKAPNLARAVFKSGARKLDGVFVTSSQAKDLQNAQELADLLPTGQVIPAAPGDAWPGDEWRFSSARVQAVWGLHTSQSGALWHARGYSGQKGETLSFQITTCGETVTLGAGQFFVQTPQGVQNSLRNGTVLWKI